MSTEFTDTERTTYDLQGRTLSEVAEEIAGKQAVDATLVRSVIGLVERSEYKRQQAAPVLKVSKKSFGMGRRFPIAAKSEV